ncbi:LuxR family transcriptional regulator [Mycobacterium sp. 3519A]|uniref:helix-turn-helix transcriptional regulator n=1 Tax=Mycobacterium sp. 3519A TaxID=2057184 RepID=UPI000C7D2016|nr:LuxR family transcriptional regulator [Mycobacterium sp. 3519A]
MAGSLGVPAVGLIGRRSEMRALGELLGAIRSGQSQVLVVSGEPGVGKTVLLEALVEQATGCLVLHAGGVQAEMELAFAGLHQLLAPITGRLDVLPQPQREALETTFGLSAAAKSDRFFIGLAALTLLSTAADEQPIICVVDDEQWLDSASKQVMAFVARRLGAESVGLVFASRTPSDELSGLPELKVDGLAVEEARVLLDSVLTAPVDPHVRDQIVTETRGNPLALLELTRGVTPAELAGGFTLPGLIPLSGRIEASFRRRLELLPEAAVRFVQLAAADPVGDPSLLWSAASLLGVDADAALPALDAGLLEVGTRVQFRHPLVRSAAYRSASLSDRQAIHRALAEATDSRVDPDRRAWHRAQASVGPDEAVAEELESSADRAQSRGGLAAAAAFLERAAALTPEPARRGGRTLAAAKAKRDAGALDAALGLLVATDGVPLDDMQLAQAQYLRGEIAFDQLRVRDAARYLQSAAALFAPLSPELTREVRLQALDATMWLADLDGPGGMRETAAAARASPPSIQPPRTVDVLLDALATLYTDGYQAGAPMLAHAIRLILADDARDDAGLWLPLARSKVTAALAAELWDAEAWHELALGLVHFARRTGAPVYLQFALQYLAWTYLLRGEFATAGLVIDEGRLVADATGNPPLTFIDMLMAAWRGHEQSASELIRATEASATESGLCKVADFAEYARSVLYNGLGRHEEALVAARRVFDSDHVGFSAFVIPELSEAASRTGDVDVITVALTYVSDRIRVNSTAWLSGIQSRLRALLANGRAAERYYRESLAQLGQTNVAAELARGHLLYGEWLRRENRRVEARTALHTADEMFTAMGVDGFAERARRELLATGETARKRKTTAHDELTPQELQVARLARDGLTNPEIGVQLFISPRTVQYHLRKVFSKLGIRSRAELTHVLSPSQVETRNRHHD